MKKRFGMLLVLGLCSALFLSACNKHTHSYTASYDAENHYEICECGDITKKQAHSYKESVVKEATTSAKGTKRYTCDCGYYYEEDIPQLEETHNYVVKYDTTNHWKECDCSNHKGQQLEKTAHSFTNVTEGDMVTYTCTCGYTYSESKVASLVLNGAKEEYFAFNVLADATLTVTLKDGTNKTIPVEQSMISNLDKSSKEVQEVCVSYGNASVKANVKLVTVSVHDAKLMPVNVDYDFMVRGVVIGVVYTGSTNELLIQDETTYEVYAIRALSSATIGESGTIGTFFKAGDIIEAPVSVGVVGTDVNTSASGADKDKTVLIKSADYDGYGSDKLIVGHTDLDISKIQSQYVYTINSQDDLVNLLRNPSKNLYKVLKINAASYYAAYTSSSGAQYLRFFLDSSFTKASQTYANEISVVMYNDNTLGMGNDLAHALYNKDFSELPTSANSTQMKLVTGNPYNGEYYAVFFGGNTYYYQFAPISLNAMVNESVWYESTTVANAHCNHNGVGEEVNIHEHVYTAYSKHVDPVCCYSGSNTYKCDVCGHEHVEIIPSYNTAHKLVHANASEATCTKDGNVENWHCTICDHYFADEEGTIELSKTDVVIKASGHEKGELLLKDGKPYYTVSKGTIYLHYDCTNCDEDYVTSEGFKSFELSSNGTVINEPLIYNEITLDYVNKSFSTTDFSFAGKPLEIKATLDDGTSFVVPLNVSMISLTWVGGEQDITITVNGKALSTKVTIEIGFPNPSSLSTAYTAASGNLTSIECVVLGKSYYGTAAATTYYTLVKDLSNDTCMLADNLDYAAGTKLNLAGSIAMDDFNKLLLDVEYSVNVGTLSKAEYMFSSAMFTNATEVKQNTNGSIKGLNDMFKTAGTVYSMYKLVNGSNAMTAFHYSDNTYRIHYGNSTTAAGSALELDSANKYFPTIRRQTVASAGLDIDDMFTVYKCSSDNKDAYTGDCAIYVINCGWDQVSTTAALNMFVVDYYHTTKFTGDTTSHYNKTEKFGLQFNPHTPTFANYVVTTAPTLTEEGVATGYCTENDGLTTTYTLPNLSDTNFWTLSNDPTKTYVSTCLAHGKDTYTGTYSSSTLEVEVELPFAEHDMTLVPEQLPVGSTDGHIEHYTCSNSCCSGKYYVLDGTEYTEISAALVALSNHIWGDWGVDSSNIPTETAAGKIKRTCAGSCTANCTPGSEAYQEVDVPKLTDTTFWTLSTLATETYAPTVSTAGKKTYFNSDYDVFVEVTFAALGNLYATQLTNVSNLTVGDIVYFVAPNKNVAADNSGSNYGSTASKIVNFDIYSDSICEIKLDTIQKFQVISGTGSGTFRFKYLGTTNYYLVGKESKNGFGYATSTDETTSFAITINEGLATLKTTVNSTNYYIGYNGSIFVRTSTESQLRMFVIKGQVAHGEQYVLGADSKWYNSSKVECELGYFKMSSSDVLADGDKIMISNTDGTYNASISGTNATIVVNDKNTSNIAYNIFTLVYNSSYTGRFSLKNNNGKYVAAYKQDSLNLGSGNNDMGVDTSYEIVYNDGASPYVSMHATGSSKTAPYIGFVTSSNEIGRRSSDTSNIMIYIYQGRPVNQPD